MKRMLIIISMASILAPSTWADPLTEEDIAAFNLDDLNSESFDDRMKVFRIIKEQGWQQKYKSECKKAIVTMLKSKDVMQNRTGIQGENLLQYNDELIDKLALALLKNTLYEKGNQYTYLRRALVEYTLRQLRLAREK